MATSPSLRLSKEVQKRLVDHAKAILQAHRTDANELRNKLTCIDVAYARWQATRTQEDGQVACNVFEKDNIIAPIVVSEVDSMVAFLADVFLSGSPLFPVVSTPANRNWAEQLETLIDDHATLGGYARQLLMFLLDSVKYNFSAVEVSWEQINQFSVDADFTADNQRKLTRENKSYNKIKRLDPYNTIFDKTVSPADVALEGDFAGYIEVLSRTKLKRFINKLTNAKKAMNVTEAFNDNSFDIVAGATHDYYIHPQISDYTTAERPLSKVDWFKYFGDSSKKTGSNNFEKTTLYVRITPSDFEMNVPQPNTPQIWKLVLINGCVLICAERIITAYDALPILFGQPLEDGLGLQTKSIAEGSIPFQTAASTLFNIRFAAARRLVSDRALYDPEMINPSDINAPVPAAKIPVRASAMKEKGLSAAYAQIPFDMRGTETTLQDASMMANFSKDLNGITAARRGQHQKGNKSVREWDDVQSGGDDRLRLRALCLEYQVFVPLKETLKLNIFQYGEDSVVVSQKSGQEYKIDLTELRKQVLAFRVADGYSPKSKLASADMLNTGMTLIMNSPILQQAYGPMLPHMFAHLMQLGGVRGLEEYIPKAPQGTAPPNLQGNLLGMPAPSDESGAPAGQTSMMMPNMPMA